MSKAIELLTEVGFAGISAVRAPRPVGGVFADTRPTIKRRGHNNLRNGQT